jgi:hypothetical protein
VAKSQPSTELCDVKDLEVVKIKQPSSKKNKRKYNWLQNIDFDKRSTKYRKVQSKEELALFTERESATDCESNVPKGAPVILPLYITATPGVTKKLNIIPEKCGIMQEKVRKYLNENSEQYSPENFLDTLAFTDKENRDD